MRVREPVARPLDVVAVELLLSASQAFLAGVLMYLAVGIWDDRGVGIGPVAIILAMLAVAVGASWLYWLMGGMGWPLAAANVPTAMFLGFVVILGWQGDDLIRLEGVPVTLALSASIFGLVGGVFLDSPRRWRWDQRQKLRPGTDVPKVSPTAKAVAARVPRSLSTRGTSAADPDSTGTRATLEPPAATPNPELPLGEAPSSGDLSAPYVASEASSETSGEAETSPISADSTSAAGGPKGAPPSFSGAVKPVDSSQSTESADRADRAQTGQTKEAETVEPSGTIELPTSVEPKAQRSPWAWAAPPEWNRDDEEDEPTSGASRGR